MVRVSVSFVMSYANLNCPVSPDGVVVVAVNLIPTGPKPSFGPAKIPTDPVGVLMLETVGPATVKVALAIGLLALLPPPDIVY